MTKKNKTYKIDKLYVNGHQYVNDVVGKTALKEYLRRLSDTLGDTVIAYTVTCCGRREQDIQDKEKINKEAMQALERHDIRDDNSSRNGGTDTDSQKSAKSELAESLGVDEERIDDVKNILENLENEDDESVDTSSEDDDDEGDLVLPKD